MQRLDIAGIVFERHSALRLGFGQLAGGMRGQGFGKVFRDRRHAAILSDAP